jgi:hypothetical protein
MQAARDGTVVMDPDRRTRHRSVSRANLAGSGHLDSTRHNEIRAATVERQEIGREISLDARSDIG